MNPQGLIGKMFSWGTSASYSDTTVETWLAGLALVLILAFLWSTVVRDMVREAETVTTS
jgi:hypothetical protein